jgi:hypothetical protein
VTLISFFFFPNSSDLNACIDLSEYIPYVCSCSCSCRLFLPKSPRRWPLLPQILNNNADSQHPILTLPHSWAQQHCIWTDYWGSRSNLMDLINISKSLYDRHKIAPFTVCWIYISDFLAECNVNHASATPHHSTSNAWLKTNRPSFGPWFFRSGDN